MEEQKREDGEYDLPAGCFLRLFWMMIGNVILVACAYGIVQHRSGMLSIADVGYWAVVGSLVAARYTDIRHLDGTTADGDPATMAHWRRYAIVLAVVCTGLWVAAHAVAHYAA